uniref:Uncharacterized protein n=1 Tax=Megaselia scalaris TaxID=36166 RepID=T1GW11_MEGSC
MKVILVITLLFGLTLAVDMEEDTWVAMKNKELLHLSCAQELHIENKTEDTIGYKEFKCLATCLMEHRGYLKHGEVDVHEVAKAIKEKTHLEKHLKSKLIADLPTCAKLSSTRSTVIKL